MNNAFYRKVGFGLAPGQEAPADPLKWALGQVDEMPPLPWPNKLPTSAEQLAREGEEVYTDRKVLREKHKTDRNAYRAARKALKIRLGKEFYHAQEDIVRTHAALHSGAPIYERLTMFWANHFALSDKDNLKQYQSGPMYREIIRPGLAGKFSDLLREVTISWPMIQHLDNSQSEGPQSKQGRWRKQNKGEATTINENHARELLELHTVSPAAGYTQRDVIQLTYIMTGWRVGYSKKRLECNPVVFKSEYHQPGAHEVLGKKYKQRNLDSKNKLLDVMDDLARHPSTYRYISWKLARHFITDEPSEEMIAPIIKAWEDSDGYLPAVHAALIEQVWAHGAAHHKFQMPAIWLTQMLNMSGMEALPSAKVMADFSFEREPSKHIRTIQRALNELGHEPLASEQPNGYPDTEASWISPEFLIRRMALASRFYRICRSEFDSHTAMEASARQNFAPEDDVMRLVYQQGDSTQRFTLFFNHPRMLKA